jgi:hypothetical protein
MSGLSGVLEDICSPGVTLALSHPHITSMFRLHACHESFGACIDAWTPWDVLESPNNVVAHTGAMPKLKASCICIFELESTLTHLCLQLQRNQFLQDLTAIIAIRGVHKVLPLGSHPTFCFAFVDLENFQYWWRTLFQPLLKYDVSDFVTSIWMYKYLLL